MEFYSVVGDLNNKDDSLILNLMYRYDIYINDQNYLMINDISHIASTYLIDRIKRLKIEHDTIKREEKLNELLNE